MAEFKLVLSTKDGKSHQMEVKEKEARPFLGKKIGDTIKGDDFGLAGYEVQIKGGSDYCGFPMRPEIQGTARKKVLAVSGVGVHKKAKGTRQRKTVCGNTIHGKIIQINLKVTKEGKEKLGKPEETAEPLEKETTGKKTEPKAEKKPEEAKPAKQESSEKKPEAAKPAKQESAEKKPEPAKKDSKEAPIKKT